MPPLLRVVPAPSFTGPLPQGPVALRLDAVFRARPHPPPVASISREVVRAFGAGPPRPLAGRLAPSCEAAPNPDVLVFRRQRAWGLGETDWLVVLRVLGTVEGPFSADDVTDALADALLFAHLDVRRELAADVRLEIAAARTPAGAVASELWQRQVVTPARYVLVEATPGGARPAACPVPA